MKLTQRQEAILLGSILGDGFLQKTGLHNARLRLEHGSKQKEYLEWKGRQFPRLFLGNPVTIKRLHPKTHRVYEYWRWQSNSTPVLGEWHNLFYGNGGKDENNDSNKNGKKHIPEELVTMLKDPLALAVWYMDDGYFYSKDYNSCSYIYLGRVTRKEAEIAVQAISVNFDITPKIYDKKQKGYALFFSVTETKKLHDLIRSYVLPVFDYKLQ